MIKYVVCVCVIVCMGTISARYTDGVLVESDETPQQGTDQLVVVDSFPSYAPSYSMGLAFDGRYLWNDEAFSHWFARVDTAGGTLLNSFTPTAGNRDMTFDGQYLWVTDWQNELVYKYDTSTCVIMGSFSPPFYGKPNGMAWDGTYLWVGEEGGQIWQLDTSGAVIHTIPAPNSSSSNPRGLAFDGTYLWVGAQTVGLIYMVDPLDGGILGTYSAPSANLQQGLTYDGHFLWSTGGNNWIYKIDPRVSVGERSKTNNYCLSVSSRPNPFHSRTKIFFEIPRRTAVNLSIYDRTGRKISQEIDSELPKGTYNVNFWKGKLSPGIYFGVLSTEYGRRSISLLVVD
jgi:glutamine cyclotransferase